MTNHCESTRKTLFHSFHKDTCEEEQLESATNRRTESYLSFWARLCINTPSRVAESTLRISMALFPHPITLPLLMYAEEHEHTKKIFDEKEKDAKTHRRMWAILPIEEEYLCCVCHTCHNKLLRLEFIEHGRRNEARRAYYCNREEVAFHYCWEERWWHGVQRNHSTRRSFCKEREEQEEMDMYLRG